MKVRTTTVIVLLLLAFWPVWHWYAKRMIDGSDAPWGLLALATAIGYLAWTETSKTVQQDPANPSLSLKGTSINPATRRIFWRVGLGGIGLQLWLGLVLLILAFCVLINHH